MGLEPAHRRDRAIGEPAIAAAIAAGRVDVREDHSEKSHGLPSSAFESNFNGSMAGI
jgi:hypothetical protein